MNKEPNSSSEMTNFLKKKETFQAFDDTFMPSFLRTFTAAMGRQTKRKVRQ